MRIPYSFCCVVYIVPLAGALVPWTWTDGLLFYQFATNISSTNRTRVRNAMNLIENVSPVRFIEREDEENYIFIQSLGGNFSYVGMLGGGHHQVEDITVSTYDSAAIHLGRYGGRFGLLIFDEVHHLGAPGYLSSAASSIAPYRLGLTATWDADAEREDALTEILGEIVYEKTITELSGEFLADYETVRIPVSLSPSEQAEYEEARNQFKQFVAAKRIPLGSSRGWQTFLRHAAQSKAGRAAFKAHQRSRQIAHGTQSKLQVLSDLLGREHGRRTVVFTHDNDTAYKVSKRFLVPCISHQTDIKERRAILAAFEDGSLPVIVTSRVLNEGVDMPAAEVAIVLSGTGTVRRG